LQIFNILFKNGFNKINGLTRFGRGMFDFKTIDATVQGVNILKGIEGSVMPTSGGLFYKADVVYRSIQKNTLDQLVQQREYKNLKNFKVYLVHTSKVVEIDYIDFNKTPSTSFLDKQGGKKTFIQYFQEKYNISIKSEQPLLVRIRNGNEECFPSRNLF
jgi:aubergine